MTRAPVYQGGVLWLVQKAMEMRGRHFHILIRNDYYISVSLPNPERHVGEKLYRYNMLYFCLKFQTFISQISQYFLSKIYETLLQCEIF